MTYPFRLLSLFTVISLSLTLALFWGQGTGSIPVVQAASPPEQVSQIYYVDADATGTPTGLSWTDAFTKLQDALAVGYWRR